MAVSLSQISAKNISVNYIASGVTALIGVDFGVTLGTLTIPAGQLSGRVSVSINDDAIYEGSETLTLDLSSPTNATISDAQGLGTITDDENPPEVSVANASAIEDTGSLAFTVTKTGSTVFPITVDYATSDGTALAASDYTSTTGTLTIPIGVSSSIISVPITADSTLEPDETLTLILSNPAVATISASSATGTITNDDGPTITDVSPVSGSDVGGVTITLTGTGFLTGATATVGGAACTSPTVVNSTSFTCVTPASATAGAVDIVLTNTLGSQPTGPRTATYTNGYTHLAHSWNFGVAGDFTYDGSLFTTSQALNKATLTPPDLTHNTQAEFDAGTHLGTVYSGGALKLNATTNYSELDASWTPKWDKVVAYWKFDNSLADSRGNAGTASVTDSISFSAVSKIGSYAGDFTSGAINYAEFSDNPTLKPNNITVQAWIKPSSITGIEKGILWYPAGTTYNGLVQYNDTIFYSFDGVNSAPQKVDLIINFGYGVPTGTPLVANTWYHIVAAYDGSTVKLFQNGKKVIQGIYAGGNLEYGAGTIRLGYRMNANSYDGLMDEVAIWNTGLSDSEVAQIYDRQKSKYSGVYQSPVASTPSNFSYDYSKWTSSLPFLKELTGDTNANGTPDSEFSSDYSAISAGGAELGSGLVGLWHFNESDWNGTANEVRDSSGIGSHLTASGGVSASAQLLSRAGMFDGIDDVLIGPTVSHGTDLSFAAWIRPDSVASTIRNVFRIHSTFEVALLHYSNNKFRFWTRNGSHDYTLGTQSLVPGQWYHVAVVINGSGKTLFVNGKLDATSPGVIASGSGPLKVAADNFNQFFHGAIDEAALWNRALSAGEVLQLYRRGANRNQFQFRTCTQANCSDDPSWHGPDNTASTWFSELHNMVSVDANGNGLGSINLNSPILDFTKWVAAVAGWGFNPIPTQYFQYRVLMESDDENNLCGGNPCMPDITAVSSIPAVSITTNVGRAFPAPLTSFLVSRSGDCGTANDVRFQMSSDDGGTYRYWNGTAWAPVTITSSYAQAAPYSTTNAFISDLGSSGTVRFKALVPSEFTKTCELSYPSVTWYTGGSSLSIADVTSVSESGVMTFTVTLSQASLQTVTVDYVTVAGTATAAADFTSTSGTLTFTPGELTKTINVTVATDALDEDYETFFVQLSNAVNAPITRAQATGTITDDDATPSLAINDPAAVTEGANINFAVTLSAVSGRTVSFDWMTANNTALAGSDYSAVTTTTVTIPAGATTATLTVSTIDDTYDEPAQTFFAQISNSLNATISDNSGIGTINDNDPAPTLAIAANSALEDSGSLIMTVTKTGLTEQAVTVDYATSNGTATAGSDYSTASGSLSFAAGDTSKTITVTLTPDSVAEGDETITVTLSNPTNSTISTASAAGTITNDDAPTISGVSPTEGTGAGGTTIALTGTGFLSGATATVGGAVCTSPNVISGTAFTCVTPAGTGGAADVVLLNSVGSQPSGTRSVTSTGGFTYREDAWNFGTAGHFTFDGTLFTTSQAQNKATLTPLDLTHDTQGEFDAGTHVGTVYSVPTQKLTLSSTLPAGAELTATSVPQPAGLVGLWRFNNDLTDAGPNGLTLSGVSGSLAYNSTDKILGSHSVVMSDWLNLSRADTPALQFTTNLTVSMWFKPLITVSGNADWPISKWNFGTSDANFVMYFFGSASGGNVNKVQFFGNRGGTWGTISADYLLTVGTWYHVALTYNSTTGGQLYVNGIPQGALTGSGVLATNAHDLTFYTSGTDPGNHFLIDETAIWNTTLTGSEVKYLYNKQLPTFSQEELNASWTPQWSSLVGYWSLNGDALDKTGNGHNGTVQGTPAWASSSKLGSGALAFDGSTNYITVPYHADFHPANTATVCAWINPATLIAGNVGVVTNRTTNTNNSLLLSLVNQNIYFHMRDTSAWVVAGTTDNPIQTNIWQHVCGTVKADSRIRIYVNGNLKNETPASGTLNYNANQNLVIGKDAWGAMYFNGQIDEVSFFSAELTSSEILQIYIRQNSKFGGIYNSPVNSLPIGSAWTKFNWLTSLPFFKELSGDSDANGAPDTESSADYSAISSGGEDLANGLVGLWHFNETSLDTGPSSEDFLDYSGLTHHLIEGGTVTTAQPGVFNKAAYFDGIDDYAYAALDIPENGHTVSLWFKKIGSTKKGIFQASNCTTANCGSHDRNIYVDDTGNLCVRGSHSGPEIFCSSGFNYSDGQWHHVVHSLGAAGQFLYADGKRYSGVQTSTAFATQSHITLGYSSYSAGSYFKGFIDEFSIWNRQISHAEALQLYRRGANRNKFQFRTCTQFDCSDSPSFKGPDNTASTWFSELHNMASVAASGEGSGTVNLLSPILDFTKWITAVAGWAFNPDPARYFQYRAILESDDENNLCSGSPCIPDIQSVASIPAVAITTTVGRAFPSALTQFNLTKAGDCGTVDDVRFQISSDNGSTYKYWNGSAWASVTTTGSYAQAAAYTATNSNIGTLASSGTFKFKALVPSQYGKTCELSSPSIRW